jgi:hypothetical protein
MTKEFNLKWTLGPLLLRHDIQHNGTQHNDTQPEVLIATLSINNTSVIMLSINTLSSVWKDMPRRNTLAYWAVRNPSVVHHIE